MNMKEAFISVLTNWKNFHGRASRSEFWYFVLASFLLGGIVVLFEIETNKAIRTLPYRSIKVNDDLL